MAFPEYQQLRFTCKGYRNGYYGFPVFWFSSSPLKPSLPIRQRSNNGNLLYYPLTVYYVYNGSYYDNSMVLFIRAETLLKHNCEWCRINQLTSTSGGSNYPITTGDFDNAISNGWSSDYVDMYFNTLTYNTVQEKIDAMRVNATRDYWRTTLVNYYSAKGYKIESFVDDLLNNSVACIITFNTPNAISGDSYNLMGPVSRSGSGGGAYPINGGADVIFTFVPIEGSKTTARSFIHTNNSYANAYQSPSICISDMKISLDSINNADLKPVNLGVCDYGPLANLTQVTKFTTAFDNAKSYYIKRDYVDTQTVTGPLNFTKSLNVEYPSNDTSLVNKGYVDNIMDLKVFLSKIMPKI